MLRKIDFFATRKMHTSFKCSIFWAIIAFIFTLLCMLFAGEFNHLFYAIRTGLFESLRTGAIGLDQFIALISVPISAILGAIFGAIFAWIKANNKASASLLQRGLVGGVIGIFIWVTIAALFYFGPANNPNDSYGRGLLLYVVLLCSALIPITIVLALLTPKQLIIQNEHI